MNLITCKKFKGGGNSLELGVVSFYRDGERPREPQED